jgi:hypothetical protein
MLQSYNGAAFGWYVSKDKTLSGIFLKSGSFNGIELIFPNPYPPSSSLPDGHAF